MKRSVVAPRDELAAKPKGNREWARELLSEVGLADLWVMKRGLGHVAAHELGAAAYAIRAARAATPEGEHEEAGRLECQWQRALLSGEILEPALDDQRRPTTDGEWFALRKLQPSVLDSNHPTPRSLPSSLPSCRQASPGTRVWRSPVRLPESAKSIGKVRTEAAGFLFFDSGSTQRGVGPSKLHANLTGGTQGVLWL